MDLGFVLGCDFFPVLCQTITVSPCVYMFLQIPCVPVSHFSGDFNIIFLITKKYIYFCISWWSDLCFSECKHWLWNKMKRLKLWIVKGNIIRWFNFLELLLYVMFQWKAYIPFKLIPIFSPNDQQNTAFELNALSAQWRELCEKNIEIQMACAKIENNIEELRREAEER